MASSFSSGEGLEGIWDNLRLKRAAKTSLKSRAWCKSFSFYCWSRNDLDCSQIFLYFFKCAESSVWIKVEHQGAGL